MEFGALSETLKYYEFELDSLDTSVSGDGGYSSLNWPVFHIGGKRPLQNLAAVKVLEVQIPFSWYAIDAPFNTFVLQETGQAPALVTLPPGNYNASTASTMLVAALVAASPSGDTYTVVYDPITQKFTFNNKSATDLPFSFVMSDVQGTGIDNPRLVLGFPPGSTTSQTYTVGNQLVSPNVVALTGPNYLFLNSGKLGSLVDIYLPSGALDLGGGNSGPQIAKIPIDVQPGGVIFWSDPDPGKWFDLENLGALTSVDFYITLGNQNRVANLNGASFSLKLGIVEKNLQKTEFGKGGREHVVKRVRQK